MPARLALDGRDLRHGSLQVRQLAGQTTLTARGEKRRFLESLHVLDATQDGLRQRQCRLRRPSLRLESLTLAAPRVGHLLINVSELTLQHRQALGQAVGSLVDLVGERGTGVGVVIVVCSCRGVGRGGAGGRVARRVGAGGCVGTGGGARGPIAR